MVDPALEAVCRAIDCRELFDRGLGRLERGWLPAAGLADEPDEWRDWQQPGPTAERGRDRLDRVSDGQAAARRALDRELEQATPDPAPLRPGVDEQRSEEPRPVADDRSRVADDSTFELGDPAAPWIA